MPELPEVETVKNGLNKLLKNKLVTDVTFDWPKGFPNSQGDINNFLKKSKIIKTERRGKALIIYLSSDYCLVIHLKMTGQLVYRGKTQFGAGHPSDSLIGPLPDRSTRVIFTFDDDSKLYFNDQRKFGWIRLMPEFEVENLDFMKKLGPDPLNDSFGASEFRTRIRRRKNSRIKSTILDQTVIAGVGNIYADESLWMSRINPNSLSGSLSDSKLNLLLESIREVFKKSIALGGSTARNYVDAEGNRGSYLKFANVYNRGGQACPRCGNEIVKIKVTGRGTHICTKCQRKTS
ncbi:MAG: bifunctional DNA-formamidopyrimidine glycosylase/DNA-(apurinic or apyrimidinic site) lyase [Candidatus Saccharibacteria bacterium]